MDVFARMLTTLFDSELAVDGEFYKSPQMDNAGNIIFDNSLLPILSNGSSSIFPVRLLESEEDTLTNFGESRIKSATGIYEIIQASMNGIIPEKDDFIKVANNWHKVKTKPITPDARRHLWRIEAVPVTG